ncbi:hypothetical protein ETB97_005953 [Aspergillus alliaceus]|uniref:Uncharacterized protein n=1 Tax=Petromyces alliaceus TaxID=209559 RepID=A0A8H6A0T9_PETAA|nr:hypothetical protein ETB97_005953 [Aspergillus burnettii]
MERRTRLQYTLATFVAGRNAYVEIQAKWMGVTASLPIPSALNYVSKGNVLAHGMSLLQTFAIRSVLQAAAIQVVLAAPPYGADSISGTCGDTRAYGDDTLYVDEPGLAITYEGDDSTVPVNPSYKDTSASDPITVPSSRGDTVLVPSSQLKMRVRVSLRQTAAEAVVARNFGSGGGNAAPEGSLSTNGDIGALGNAGTIGTAATAGTAGVAGAGSSWTFQGDVSNPPPAQKPAEIYIDEDGNEGPVSWTSEENTFSLDVQGEGEGTLSESGRPGPSRGSGGPSQAGKS